MNSELRFQSICIIMQGLLASGHYTVANDSEDSIKYGKHDPAVIREDNGTNWRELDEHPVFARRYSSSAVLQAIELFDELLEQVRINEQYKS